MSGTTRRRRLAPAARRAQLLAAAEDAFVRHGYQGTAIEDIADAAEYARQLSLELNGSVVKVFDAETGLVIFTAKSRAKIED